MDVKTVAARRPILIDADAKVAGAVGGVDERLVIDGDIRATCRGSPVHAFRKEDVHFFFRRELRELKILVSGTGFRKNVRGTQAQPQVILDLSVIFGA